MSEKKLLIYDKKSLLNNEINNQINLKKLTTLNHTEQEIFETYKNKPDKFSHIILISTRLTQSLYQLSILLQETSPFAEIIVQTHDVHHKETYKYIKIGIPIQPISINLIDKLLTDKRRKIIKTKKRIQRYFELNILKKIEQKKYQNEYNHYNQSLFDSKQNGSILSIEPEPLSAHILTTILPNKYLVKTAENIDKAIKNLKHISFNLIILSDQIPYKKIKELLTYLQKNSIESRIILLTNIHATQNLEYWYTQGIHNIIFKPFPNTKELLNTLEEEFQNYLFSNLFKLKTTSQLFNSFKKEEKVHLIKEIYQLKKSINKPLCFEDILRVFPEANINKKLAKKSIPKYKLEKGIQNFIEEQI